MKIDVVTTQVDRQGTTAETNFRIGSNMSKAFKLLSNTLYSNKIAAVIRELSCNAYDSHKAAKKTNVPFIVHLPNAMEPEFSVEDFGIGLSEDDITGLYTTYFESTKTATDDFIGGFGLGSKSPFAYTNQFGIRSRWNGVETIFNAFMNEQYIPTLVKMASVPTSEPNGIKVTVPVKSTDFDAFRINAQRIFYYFDVKPTITGNVVTIPTRNVIVEGTGWALVADNGSRPVAIQGNVHYPLDLSTVADSLRNATVNSPFADNWANLSNVSLEITFPIGELDPAPDREKLSYDDRTNKNIIVAVERMLQEYRDKVTSEITKATSYFEAISIFKKMRDSSLGFLLSGMQRNKATRIQWNGKDLEDAIEVDMENFKMPANWKLYAVSNNAGRFKRTELNKFDTVRVAAGSNSHFIVHSNTLQRGDAARRLREHVLSNMRSGTNVYYLKFEDPKDHKAKDDKGATNIINFLRNEFDGVEIKNIAELDEVVVEKKPRAARGTAKVAAGEREKLIRFRTHVEGSFAAAMRTAGDRVDDTLWVRNADVEIEDGGVYMVIVDGRVKAPGYSSASWYESYFVNLIERNGFFQEKLVLVTEKYAARLAEMGNWKNLKDYVAEELARFEKNSDQVIDFLATAKLKSELNLEGYYLLCKAYDYNSGLFNGSQFEDFGVYKSAFDTVTESQQHLVNNAEVYLRIKLPKVYDRLQEKTKKNPFLELVSEMIKEYPLLVNLSSYTPVEKVVEYIKLVNKN